MRMKDVVLMATVSTFESMPQPGRHELKQFSELFEPIFKASGMEARRNAIAALSRCHTLPEQIAWFIATQPIAMAAIFITSSPALSDTMLIELARSQGPAYARAVAARDNLSVKVVDALVSLHTALEKHLNEDAIVPRDAEAALSGEQGFVMTREEQVRQQLKSLVQRDTIARAAGTAESLEDMSLNLLVRFARLREARNFSHALADALGSSRWLSERIMLDLSGQQLGTALMALGAEPADGQFMLAQLYPHLANDVDGKSRARILWEGLDPERCDERMLAWLRADDEAEGRTPMADAANANDAAERHAGVERPAAEAAHGHLEGLRPPVLAQRDRLAVEDRRLDRELAQPLDDLRRAIGDVREVAREQANLVSESVRLDTSAVELPLDRRGPGSPQRLAHVVGRLREHRLDRPQELEPEERERVRAAAERRLRDLAKIAGEHQRAPNSRGGKPRRLRDRLRHHALERALPQPSEQQAGEERLLRLRRAPEEGLELLAATSLRAGSANLCDARERGVDLEQLERRLSGRRRQLSQRGPPHADRSLREDARQIGHGRSHLLRSRPGEAVGETADLGEPGRRAGDVGRRLRDLREEHQPGPDVAACATPRCARMPTATGRRAPRARPNSDATGPRPRSRAPAPASSRRR